MKRHLLAVAKSMALAVGVLSAGGSLAAPTYSYNANVTSWNVGSGQSNGRFSVASDTAFNGGGIQLGLRAQQRRVAAVAPTGTPEYFYQVQTGVDPGTTRAWWNFDFSIGYDGSIASLDRLLLGIFDGVTGAALTIVDLNPVRTSLDADNGTDMTFKDLYQASQNPTFGWFSPPYAVNNPPASSFWFVLHAAEGDTSLSANMCVYFSNQCTADPPKLPEPGSLLLIALGLAGLGVARRQRAG